MTEEIKQCIQCESKENLKAFDMTGRLFCSLDHFQQFYKAHNTNNAVQSHEQLNIQDILGINEQDNAFIKALPEDNARALKIIETRILDLQRLQQSMRLSEMTLKKHHMKIREREESNKVERYRKEGCNSDLELKEKRVSLLGKKIISYKKMNMSDEQIINILTSITKFSRDEIMKEMKEL
jgi:hypothetical protein